MNKIFLNLFASVIVMLGNSGSFSKGKIHQVTFGPLAELGPVISPDGRWVAFEYFAPDDHDGIQLWITPVGAPFSMARAIVNDGQYHAGISWSPDSHWLAYMTSEQKTPGSSLGSSQIDKTDIYTHRTVRLTNLPEGTSVNDAISWSSDGRIAFSHDDIIYAIPDTGGEPRSLITLTGNRDALTITPVPSISWSPDARRIAFWTPDDPRNDNSKTLWIADPATNKMVAVMRRQDLCCVAWPLAQTLILSRMDKDLMKVYSFSLKSREFQQLTDGPMDVGATMDPARGLLFFNHFLTRNFEVPDSLVPKIHIWMKTVSSTSPRSVKSLP